MLHVFALVAAMAVTMTGGAALAGTVETVGGQRYTGAVIGAGSDSLQFAWQKSKDQPDDIKRGDADRAFQAQGDEAVAMSFAMSELAFINGVPPAVFKVLYSGNLYYRLVQTLDRGRVYAMSSGDFVTQVKGIVVLMLTLCLLMPLLMLIVSRILPGQGMGFFGGTGYSITLFAVGLAFATGSSLLTAAVPFFATSGLQYILSGVLVVLVAFVIHVVSIHTFWQGLGFTAAWAIAMVIGSEVASVLLSSGLVDQAIH